MASYGYPGQLSSGMPDQTPPHQHHHQQQHPSPTSTAEPKMKVGSKSRPSRAGTRSVSTLSASQLERKRANDREAQRAIRQRTKEHIETLERRISELTSGDDLSEKLGTASRRIEELEQENALLRTRLAQAAGALGVPESSIVPQSDTAMTSVGASSTTSGVPSVPIARSASTSPASTHIPPHTPSVSQAGVWQTQATYSGNVGGQMPQSTTTPLQPQGNELWRDTSQLTQQRTPTLSHASSQNSNFSYGLDATGRGNQYRSDQNDIGYSHSPQTVSYSQHPSQATAAAQNMAYAEQRPLPPPPPPPAAYTDAATLQQHQQQQQRNYRMNSTASNAESLRRHSDFGQRVPNSSTDFRQLPQQAAPQVPAYATTSPAPPQNPGFGLAGPHSAHPSHSHHATTPNTPSSANPMGSYGMVGDNGAQAQAGGYMNAAVAGLHTVQSEPALDMKQQQQQQAHHPSHQQSQAQAQHPPTQAQAAYHPHQQHPHQSHANHHPHAAAPQMHYYTTA